MAWAQYTGPAHLRLTVVILLTARTCCSFVFGCEGNEEPIQRSVLHETILPRACRCAGKVERPCERQHQDPAPEPGALLAPQNQAHPWVQAVSPPPAGTSLGPAGRGWLGPAMSHARPARLQPPPCLLRPFCWSCGPEAAHMCTHHVLDVPRPKA